jgi:uncharacterized membrane protein YphA (DoxX/SURF4 family)
LLSPLCIRDRTRYDSAMFVIAIVWLYFSLLLAIGLWPNVLAMVGTFVVLGILPAAFLFHNLRGSANSRIRERQRARRDAELMQQPMGNRDDGDTDKDQQ